ncbi:TonB-dependent receptor domain-containing protein [Chitinophaga sancti]|nr:TonB-dependent receptor [Chitinophaga sancti]WQG89293.1 TonB-dependent receptor [Chitinophaga sancti]
MSVAQSRKVSVSVIDQGLKTVLAGIQAQSHYNIIYSDDVVQDGIKVSLSITDAPVSEVLRRLLKPHRLTYKLSANDMIVIFKDTLAINGHRISGSVTDQQGNPMIAAGIILQLKSDSTIVKTALSDDKGEFILSDIKEGHYYLQATYVTYVPFVKEINVNNSDLALGRIILVEGNKVLKSVEVVGKKAFIEQQIDRVVVNVHSLISNEGANALEVLAKSPGVLVDENGSITFKGKSGVMVLIDDKPTYLSSENLATYLKSLPASALDKIELMSNPPAKYDAAGNAGLINIRTRSTKVTGFHATISGSAGQAVYPRHSENINMNYRVNKVNLFANAGYNERKGYRKLDLQRNYFDEGNRPLSVFKQRSYFIPVNKNPTIKGGVDFYASARTTVGMLLNWSSTNEKENNPVLSSLYNGQGVLDSSINADNNTNSKFTNTGVNLNYSHKFDSLGRTLTADFDYVGYRSKNSQSFLNKTFNPSGDLIFLQHITNSLPANIDIYAAKGDYTYPLKKGGKVEAGIKGSYVNTDNEARYFNVVDKNEIFDETRSNHFFYKEKIAAGYLNFNKDYHRLAIQLGLRAENTNAHGHQTGNSVQADSAFTQTYLSIFPTAYLSYKLDSSGDHKLNASYGRRIGRAYYQDLNPFITIIDKFTYFAGNPFLKPQFSSNYELTYSYKSTFNTTLLYNYSSNIQTETIEQAGNIFISRPGNIGKKEYVGITVYLSLQPVKWWTFNVYNEGIYVHYKGNLYSSDLSKGKAYWYGSITSQFTFGKGWSAELSGYYITSTLMGQFVSIPTGQVGAGVQKKILKDKGSVYVNGRDVFHTLSPSGKITNIPGATSNYHNYLDTQIVTVGFTYSFGKLVTNQEKRQTGSAESEESRVKK